MNIVQRVLMGCSLMLNPPQIHARLHSSQEHKHCSQAPPTSCHLHDYCKQWKPGRGLETRLPRFSILLSWGRLVSSPSCSHQQLIQKLLRSSDFTDRVLSQPVSPLVRPTLSPAGSHEPPHPPAAGPSGAPAPLQTRSSVSNVSVPAASAHAVSALCLPCMDGVCTLWVPAGPCLMGSVY